MEEKIGQIFQAIKMAVEALDSQAELARKCGVSKSFIHNYLNGKVHTMEMDMFFRLYPHIKKYLPPGFLSDDECEKDILDSEENNLLCLWRKMSKDNRTIILSACKSLTK